MLIQGDNLEVFDIHLLPYYASAQLLEGRAMLHGIAKALRVSRPSSNWIKRFWSIRRVWVMVCR